MDPFFVTPFMENRDCGVCVCDAENDPFFISSDIARKRFKSAFTYPENPMTTIHTGAPQPFYPGLFPVRFFSYAFKVFT
jgi:hypothetical protein